MPAFNAVGMTPVAMGVIQSSSPDVVASLLPASATASVGTISASGNGSASVVGVSAAASAGAVSATIGAQIATHVTVPVVDTHGNPIPGLSGLKWAFFDQSTLNTLRAPVAQGVGGATDGAGNLTVSITGTGLQPGQIGTLTFSDGNGNPAQVPAANAFIGPVVVA